MFPPSNSTTWSCFKCKSSLIKQKSLPSKYINISWVYLYFNHHANQFNRQPTKKGLKAAAYVQWNASSEVFPETGSQPKSFQEKNTLEHKF